MERPIDFSRARHMLCDGCGRRFVADREWIARWESGHEACPGCGVDCEQERAPKATVDPNDVALDDALVPQLNWYHTSTYPDWPTLDFDPAADWTKEAVQRMGGARHVASWVQRQRTKALHVGTYEAAVHNMLRRIADQGDEGKQFYLYRVHLKPDVVVREGWIADPGGLVGDVPLDEVCPTGVDVTRYLNMHEDVGGISLALGRGAIDSVQGIAVPLLDADDAPWVQRAAAALVAAQKTSDEAPRVTSKLDRFLARSPASPRVRVASALVKERAQNMPEHLRDALDSVAELDDGDTSVPRARRRKGLFLLLEEPSRVLAAIDRQPLRSL